MTAVPNKTITGPNIDRLADGIYGPVIKELTDKVSDLTGTNKVLRAEAKKLRKLLKGATNHNETLLGQLAEVRKAREELTAENKRLKARLLNEGIKP
jgi:hypothetical protein